MVPDIDHTVVDVLTQTHRVDIALSASVPAGLGVHRFREKAQVGNRPVFPWRFGRSLLRRLTLPPVSQVG